MNKTTNATFSNPVMTLNYLFTYTTKSNITLRHSRYLTDNWDNTESRVVFNPDSTSGEPWSTRLWAPEIHNISGSWYIIFPAISDGDKPPRLLDAMCPAINHRMFVLAGDGPDPWTAKFEMKPMVDTYDMFAIDGTYFHFEDRLYHIYSYWEHKYSSCPANLCITRMSDPWTVNSTLSERRIISVPYGRLIRLATNEGPQQLTNPKTGQNFIIYSAARVNTPVYCLGMLELVGNDLMEYQSWKKRTEGYFVSSPDESEDYVVYHAQTTANPSSDLYRTARIQKLTWNEDGTPKFPLAENGPLPVPAGQQALTKDRMHIPVVDDKGYSLS
ncbi:glycoside hydrolase family 43 protein [Daldinia sp. EC12]|nr:glycoside hydrolase family 43 protein [Daldinia sp. EC12]